MSGPRGRRRLAAGIAAAVALAALLLGLALLRPARRRQAPPEAAKAALEGIDLVYFDFDRENRKKLEVRCRESVRLDEERLGLKGVAATIFASGQLDEDIHVRAEQGTAANNFHDFSLRERARIAAGDFTLNSRSFQMKGLDFVSGSDPVDFEIREIRGRGFRGLEYYISQKVLKFLACRGTWTREGVPYDFRSRVFWAIRRESRIVLEKDAALAGGGSTLRSPWISLLLDGEFSRLRQAAAIGRSSFQGQVQAGGGAQTRGVEADLIELFYDDPGRLERIAVRGSGSLQVSATRSSARLRSDSLEIRLRPDTQVLERAQALSRGDLETGGRQALAVSADALAADFAVDGELARAAAAGDCRFRAAGLSGSAARLDHDAAADLTTIAGKGTEVRSGGNTFRSSRFQLRGGALETDKGVKATIVPPKKSALLAARPVFVTAGAVNAARAGGASRFSGEVILFQDGLELRAGELVFAGSGGGLSCAGGADVSFRGGENGPLRLRGQTIAMAAERGRVVAEGGARLEQGGNELAAQRLELVFGADDALQDVYAGGDATFRRQDIAGRAQALHWMVSRQEVLFRERAEIARSGAGTTRGEELRLDLAGNRITVSGRGERSQTTLGDGRP